MLVHINGLTVYQLLKCAANENAQKEAVYDLVSRRTYGQLIKDVDHLASVFYKLGIRKGDRIAVGLPNWYETVLLYFATAKLGAILVPFNPQYTVDEINHIIQVSQPKLLFVTDNLNDEELELLSKHKAKVVIVRGYRSTYDMFTSLLEKEASPINEAKIKVSDDVYCILFTSGTTGSPKGVMITHQSVVKSGLTIASELHCTGDDVYIIAAPLFHIFGMACNLFSAVSTYCRMVLVEKYVPLRMLQLMEEEKVTIQQGVPTMFLKELELDEFDNFNLTSLRTGIVGAAPITREQVKEIRRKFGMNLCQSYGITETGSVTMTPYDDPEEKIATTLGKAIPGVELRIVDENRQELPANEVGEIAIKSFGVMKGYYKMPEETKKVLDKNGWFYTGDLGRLDEDGYLYFVGRHKELIIRGGFNIYPQEIEAVLLKHSSVGDVAVIGLPDETLGETVCAVIQLKADQELSKTDVINYLSQRISTYKVPQEVIFIDKIPITPSGKVKKKELKQEITTMMN